MTFEEGYENEASGDQCAYSFGKEAWTAALMTKDSVDVNFRCHLAEMENVTAWINFIAAQANRDMARYGEWRCDYEMQASALQAEYERSKRELMDATNGRNADIRETIK